MVKIISGPINTGKTTWLLSDYKKQKNADGFACRKVKVNSEHIGYELIHLKTGEICQFIRKIDHIPENWNEGFRYGMHYSFNKEGLAFAERIANEAIAKGVDTFYLDEIGHLELRDMGFAPILKAILKTNINLVVIIRELLVQQVCEKFGIQHYSLMTPS